MSGRHRTPLTTSQKVECAALALAGQEVHGTISALSRQFDISRPMVYGVRGAVGQMIPEGTSASANKFLWSCELAGLAIIARRTLCRGGPMVLQDTDFSKVMPCGKGLFAVNNVEDAAEAINEIIKVHHRLSKWATEFAHDCLDARLVLTRLLSDCGI